MDSDNNNPSPETPPPPPPNAATLAEDAPSTDANISPDPHPTDPENADSITGSSSPSAPQRPSNDDADLNNPDHEKPKPEEEVVEEAEIREPEQPASGEIKPPEAPPLAPDLEQISQEIEQYILNLSTSQQDESPPTDVPIFLEQFALLVETKVADYDSAGGTHIKWISLGEEDSASFLQATTRLISLSEALLKFSPLESKYAYTFNRIGGVLQRVMSYVEEEFKSLLGEYNFHDADPNKSTADAMPTKEEPSSSSSSISNPESEQNPLRVLSLLSAEGNTFPGYPQEILSELIRLSKVLMAGGREQECFRVYFVARRNAFEESLLKLGFEKYSMDDVHKMQWEQLEREILAWISALKQCAVAQFVRERKLCEAVLPGQPKISGSLFCSLSHGVMSELLNFAQAVALTKRAAEKLFRFLDMYETLRDMIPTIESIYPEDWVMREIKAETELIKCHLGDAMVSILSDLGSSIQADPAKTCVPGGAVHPLTRYTMNYMKCACEYKEILDQVFKEHITKIERGDPSGKPGSDSSATSQSQNEEREPPTPFQNQMTKMMDVLDANLEAKSKLYKDPSLSAIFMMNNGRYILQKIRGSSKMNRLMGDPWCRKRSSGLRHYHKEYQRETWGKLLSCFRQNGLVNNGKVSKPVLKERFKSFNSMFEDIHKTQSGWVVSDEQLQSELRVSISNMVVPAYRSYLGRYSQVFSPGRQTEKYVKYQAEDVESCIEELFDGDEAAQMGRRKP